MDKNFHSLLITDQDDVAVALANLTKDTKVQVKKGQKLLKITLLDDIPIYHKFSIRLLQSGENLLKYGEVIGRASQDILLGSYVHTHNLESKRG